MRTRTEWLLLAGLMLALATARVTAGHWLRARAFDTVMSSDSYGYEASALALMETGRFAVGPHRPGEPQNRRTPGYPVFIALVYSVFGKRNHAALLDIQALLSVLVLPLAFALARRRWGRTGAWAAALILALDPISFLYSGRILSETLFTIPADGNAAGRRHRGRGATRLGVGLRGRPGAGAGGARAADRVLPDRFAARLAGGRAPQAGRRRRGGLDDHPAFLPWLILVGGWQTRNYLAVGRPVLSTIGELNQFDYRAAGVIALRDGIPIQESRRRLARAHPAEPDTGRIRRWMGRKGRASFSKTTAGRAHDGPRRAQAAVRPAAVLAHQLARRALRQFRLGRLDARTGFSAETWRRLAAHPGELAFTLCVELHAVALYLLAPAALWLVWRRRRARAAALDTLLWGTILYFVIFSSGPEANPRFRVPIVPAMAILAGGIMRKRNEP